MFGLGIPELVIILVIIVVIFGASRLPEIGSGIGKGIKNFKKSIKGEDEIDVSPKKEDDKKKDEVDSK
jgi:sec-independent protein translocase protein TatA